RGERGAQRVRGDVLQACEAPLPAGQALVSSLMTALDPVVGDLVRNEQRGEQRGERRGRAGGCGELIEHHGGVSCPYCRAGWGTTRWEALCWRAGPPTGAYLERGRAVSRERGRFAERVLDGGDGLDRVRRDLVRLPHVRGLRVSQNPEQALTHVVEASGEVAGEIADLIDTGRGCEQNFLDFANC